jgi:hypothetical protein
VRDRVHIVGHLHRQLAAGREPVAQPGEQRAVVGQPVQRRVGEDHGRRRGRGIVADVGVHEAHAVALRRARQHAGGAVDADGRVRAGALVQRPGQPAGAAAEVDEQTPVERLQQRGQVPERLLSLGGEALVLRRAPAVGRHGGESATSTRASRGAPTASAAPGA